MTKEAFLSQLQSCMAKRNIDRATAEKFMQRFTTIMNLTPPEELQQKIASFGTPEEIAARISKLSASGAAKDHAPQERMPQERMPQERREAPVQRSKRPPVRNSAPGNPAGSAERPAAGAAEREPGEPRSQKGQPSAGPSGRASSASHPSQKAKEQQIVLSEKGKRNFLWTAILTSPIWGFLLCVLLGVFILAYTAVIFLAAVLIVCEVALIVGGVLLAVVGVVYGVMKMLPGAEATYIGLYELGLGIRVGGFTMLFSILVYNAVVNLTPLALKQLTRLAKFTARSIGALIQRVRKEFAKV